MESRIDHQTCSELLRPFTRGELPARDTAAVAAHLETCWECRSEQAGIQRLVSVQIPPLTDVERSNLQDAVARRTHTRLGERESAQPSAGLLAWWRRRALVPATAAAAVVALVLSGAVIATRVMVRGDGGGEAASTQGVGIPFGPQVPGSAQTQQLDLPPPSPSAAGALPRPVFDADAGALSRRDLRTLGSRGQPFLSYRRFYTAEQAWSLSAAYQRDLVAAAPDALTQSQIATCSARVLSAAPGGVLPAYAALARLHGRPALVLGFVSIDDRGRDLNRFMIFAWDVGSCGKPKAYETGIITAGGRPAG